MFAISASSDIASFCLHLEGRYRGMLRPGPMPDANPFKVWDWPNKPLVRLGAFSKRFGTLSPLNLQGGTISLRGAMVRHNDLISLYNF